VNRLKVIKVNKIFGAPFDPADSPERLKLKLAYIFKLMQPSERRSSSAQVIFHDPYDVVHDLIQETSCYENIWLGKMAVDSWLTPRPKIEDLSLLTISQARSFLESNGCWKYALRLATFVEDQIFPGRPIMIGVDHSLTGGLLIALSKKYENLNVIVLDAHFDVIRSNGFSALPRKRKENSKLSFYHCGNFLAHVLEKGIVRPENLWVLGLANATLAEKNNICEKRRFTTGQKEILRWLQAGVHVYPKEMLSGLRLDLNGPTYVSIDMDVGSFSSVYSARFMNCYGLCAQNFLSLLSTVRKSLEKAEVPLVGMDIMEIDVHLLEAAEVLSFKDQTRDIVKYAFDILLS